MKKHSFVAGLLILVILGGAKKIFDLAAPPREEKKCDFAYPNEAGKTQINSTESSLRLSQSGGTLNDASCLNKTSVYGVVDIRSLEDIQNALSFARENKLTITTAGQRHSMGGQSLSSQGLILDMRNFNGMELHKKTLTVQAGATWADAQQFLDAKQLSVKAMQSINIFTVGGTLSVNAHGIAHNPGPVASTVKSLKILNAEGEIVSLHPSDDLFHYVLGGYGLFGVILEAELEVVENETYDWKTEYISYEDYPDYYQKNIEGNENLGLTYARLSIAPGKDYLRETAVHTFKKIQTESLRPLEIVTQSWPERLTINFSKTGGLGRWTRWQLEKLIVPSKHTCITRNQAMSPTEVCEISRNQKMYDSMAYLKNRLPDTDILQEYFIPHDLMKDFVDGLRETVQNNKANLLNVTIRIVHKDQVTALPYAKEDMFAFVLYFNQGLNEADSKVLQKTTVELIDLSNSLKGTFYLPYQLYYSAEQLREAYPEVDDFFAAKKRYDPSGLFTNKFYEKYSQELIIQQN